MTEYEEKSLQLLAQILAQLESISGDASWLQQRMQAAQEAQESALRLSQELIDRRR
jgi:hypothetical protein